MITGSVSSVKRLSAAAAGIALILTGCISTADVSNLDLIDRTTDAGLPRATDAQSAELLSAFFGLDNKLPRLANVICQGAKGRDGMPVIFSTEIDPTTMQAGDFQVTLRSGSTGTMHCASLLPATDAGELRTVLLIGEFGDATSDPPARVDMIGHLRSLDGKLDYKGASAEVTPLIEGPGLVMAEIVSANATDLGLGLWRTKGSKCPSEDIAQAVRAIWAGGVTLEDGSEPGQEEGKLYKVTVQSSDGVKREVAPIALADLGDGDNNHLLCLDTADHPISISFPAGILADPNDDLNPATSIAVTDAP